MSYSLVLHGGAGPLNPDKIDDKKAQVYFDAMEKARKAGEKIISQKGTAAEIAEATVAALEDEPLFNAGRGAVLNENGKIETEASIMCGKTLQAGAASALTQVKNPISLAKKIMEKSPHVLLYGQGAELFAKEQGLQSKEVSWFYTQTRIEQWEKSAESKQPAMDHDSSQGTVGCVARDADGNIAAATSTGGMNRKWKGRIGDSAMIGPGTYANNESCAISCTGTGEYFIRTVIAYDVHAQMIYQNKSLEEAANNSLQKLKDLGGEGGLIGIDKDGNIAMPFNSTGMFRLSRDQSGKTEMAIF